MASPTYTIILGPDNQKKVTVKRASDGLVSRCYFRWLEPVPGSDTVYQAKSKVMAIRMGNLEWTTEG